MILTVGVIIIVFVWFPGIDALNATRSRTYQSCIRVCRAKFDPRRDGYQQFPEDYHHHDSNGFHQTSRMRTLAPDWIKLAKNWERERGIEKKETITFERLWWNWPVDSIRMNIAERWYKGVSQLRQARMGPLFGRESRDISSLRPDEHRWPRWICGHDHARDKDQESWPRDELSHCVPPPPPLLDELFENSPLIHPDSSPLRDYRGGGMGWLVWSQYLYPSFKLKILPFI